MSQRFLDALHSGRVILMDGAMGTEILRAGARDGECLELWNLTCPDRVQAIHQSYLDAGATCLVTNTFQASRKVLLAKGVRIADLALINERAVELADSVADGTHFVLGSVGPPAPGDNSDAATVECLDQIHLFDDVDGILLETQGNLECVAAILREKASVVGLPPFLVSFSFSNEGRDVLCRPSWATPDAVGRFAEKARPQIAALGVNCGRDMGMNEVVDVIRRYRRATSLPLFARPNAGTPIRADDGWQYPLSPAEMAGRLPDLLAAGVSMVGGCCGTTPAHIAAMRPVIDTWNARTESAKS